MKKLNISIPIVTALLLVAACKPDFLEREATDAIPEENVFEDPALMPLVVNNMYLDVPSFDFGLYDNITDESRCYWGGGPLNVVQGQWFADNNPMEYWPYAAIRKANMFLSRVDESPIDDEKKSTLVGQVKFL